MDTVQAVVILLSILGFFLIMAIVWLIYKWKRSQLDEVAVGTTKPPHKKLAIYRGKVVPLPIEGQAGIRLGEGLERPRQWLSPVTSLHRSDNKRIYRSKTPQRWMRTATETYENASALELGIYPWPSSSIPNDDHNELNRQKSTELSPYQYLVPKRHPSPSHQPPISNVQKTFVSPSPIPSSIDDNTDAPTVRMPKRARSLRSASPARETFSSKSRSKEGLRTSPHQEDFRHSAPQNSLGSFLIGSQEDLSPDVSFDKVLDTSTAATSPVTLSEPKLTLPQSKYQVPLMSSKPVESPKVPGNTFHISNTSNIENRRQSWLITDPSADHSDAKINDETHRKTDSYINDEAFKDVDQYSRPRTLASSSTLDTDGTPSTITVAVAVPVRIPPSNGVRTVSLPGGFSRQTTVEGSTEFDHKMDQQSRVLSPKAFLILEDSEDESPSPLSESSPSSDDCQIDSHKTGTESDEYHTAHPSPASSSQP